MSIEVAQEECSEDQAGVFVLTEVIFLSPYHCLFKGWTAAVN